MNVICAARVLSPVPDPSQRATSLIALDLVDVDPPLKLTTSSSVYNGGLRPRFTTISHFTCSRLATKNCNGKAMNIQDRGDDLGMNTSSRAVRDRSRGAGWCHRVTGFLEAHGPRRVQFARYYSFARSDNLASRSAK
jgi:hypothetical protein